MQKTQHELTVEDRRRPKTAFDPFTAKGGEILSAKIWELFRWNERFQQVVTSLQERTRQIQAITARCKEIGKLIEEPDSQLDARERGQLKRERLQLNNQQVVAEIALASELQRGCREAPPFVELAFRWSLPPRHVLSAGKYMKRSISYAESWPELPAAFQAEFTAATSGWSGLEQTPNLELLDMSNLIEDVMDVFNTAGRVADKKLRGDIQDQLLALRFKLSRHAGYRKTFSLANVVCCESRIGNPSGSRAKNPAAQTIVSQLKEYLPYMPWIKSNRVIKGNILGTRRQWSDFVTRKTHKKYAPERTSGTVQKGANAIRKLIDDVYPCWRIELKPLVTPSR